MEKLRATGSPSDGSSGTRDLDSRPGSPSLVLGVLGRVRVVARRDRILAPNLAVRSFRDQFAPTLIFEHVTGGALSLPLGVVHAAGLILIVSFVGPFAVVALIDSSVLAFGHDVLGR